MMWKLFVNNVCLISLFSTTATCQLLRISDVDEVYEGSTFHLTCDSKRVQLPPNASTALGIMKIQILYKRYSGLSSPFTVLAEFAYYNQTADTEIKNIPAGRDWDVAFNGFNHGVNNIYTARLDIFLRGALCSDTGVYACSVTLVMDRSATLKFGFVEEQVKVKAKVKQPEMTLDPLVNPPPGLVNQSTYELDTTVTVTCRTEGPDGLTFKWKLEIRPAIGGYILFEDFPPNHRMITHDTPSRSPGGLCPEYRYLSTLKLTITTNDKKRRYRCVVQDKGVDVAFAEVLVNVKEGSQPAKGPESSDGKEIHQGPERPRVSENGEGANMYRIVCDPSQVTFPQEGAGVTDIDSLQVCFTNTESEECELLAHYFSKDPTNQRQIKNIPPGRDWDITFSGANNGVHSIQSMKIVIEMRDPKCTDAGKYICFVNYLTETKQLQTLTYPIIVTQDDVGKCHTNDGPSQHLTSVFIILIASRVASL